MPPPELAATGWQPGMPIPAAYQNGITYLTDQWIQFLSEGINSTVLATSLDHSMRLIGGGTFAYNAVTTTLSWNAPLYIAIPSIPDADNTIPAGSVVVPSGSVAYVSCNMPFTTSGDLTSGSKTVKNVAFDGSIAVGQTVTGQGIPANTTVATLSKTTLTLSQAATASGSQIALTFANTGNLTVSVAATTALVPNPQTTVIARSLGAAISVGVGSTELWLRDAEQRTLVTAGYVTTVQAPAGANIAALQPVYMSQGTADGRTQGSLYPCDASAANGLQRSYCVGFAHTSTTSGNVCHVVQGGFLSGFTGLVPGAVYFLDPANVGGITPTKPTAQGQFVAPIGVATSTTQLLIAISPNLPITNVFQGIVVNGTTQLNGLTTAKGQTTIQGDSTTSNILQLKPTLPGNTVSGFSAANGTNTWFITDTGGMTLQNLELKAGVKQVISMGSYWTGNFSQSNEVSLQTIIYNNASNTTGVMDRYFACPFAGSIVGLQFRFYSSISAGPQIQIRLNRDTVLTRFQGGSSGAGNYTNYIGSFARKTLNFNAGDNLGLIMSSIPAGANVQVTADLVIEFNT